MTRVAVRQGGFLTIVQDSGRWGREHWGVPVNGYLDELAAQWANWLLGNPLDAAVLEITAAGPELEVLEDGPLAWAGADFPVQIDGVAWPPGESRVVARKSRIRFGYRKKGLRCYLAFPGGICVPKVMGSRATDLASGIGGYDGRALRPGDEIASTVANALLRRTLRRTVRTGRILRVVPGTRPERLPAGSLTRLLTAEFRVSKDSSAMGLRLTGSSLGHPRGDWPSEGMAIGAVECPPSGEPLVLLKNRGSIGGYPVVAHVIRADWPVLAQLGPEDSVSFALVDHETAHAAVVELFAGIGSPAVTRTVPTPAPWAGLMRRRDVYGRTLADAGDWVERGQLIGILESLGQSHPVVVDRPGLILDMVGDGELVQEGRILWTLTEEVLAP